MRFFSIVLLALALGGCATVSSGNFRDGNIQGIPYSLARGQLQISIVDDGGALSVSLAGPVVSADVDGQMIAKINRSALADNNVTITVDPKTNLLTKVDATSTGRLGDIAKQVARSYAFQGAGDLAGTPVFNRLFNPLVDPIEDINLAANAALQAYFDRRCVTGLNLATYSAGSALANAGYTESDSNTAMLQRLLRCRALQEAGVKATSQGAINLIRLGVGGQSSGTISLSSDNATASRAQCARGICFRPFRPVDVSLGLGEYYSQNDVFLLPDPTKLAYINLASGVFAEQKYVVDFTDGMMTSFEQDSQSELLGLVKVPADVAAELIRAPTEALGLKKTELEAENQYLQTVRTNADEQNKTEEACNANPGACPDRAFKIIRLKLTDEAEQAGPPPDSDGPGTNVTPPGSDGPNIFGG